MMQEGAETNKRKASELRIAISGKSGCGNTTVSSLVAEMLGLKLINFTFRNLAQEHGMSLEEVLRLAQEDESWDREVDSRQVALAQEYAGCVLGSRLAIWIFKDADIKVYLTARPETRVNRIFSREGGNREEIARFTEMRDGQDRERYMKLYGIDNDIYDFADLIIDTDEMNQGEIANIIINKANEIIR